MTDPNTPAPSLEPATAPEANPNLFTFDIPYTDPKTQIGIDLSTIPAEVRMDLLKGAVRSYIVNSVNQANQRAAKANAAFDAYDKAMAVDALQTAVPKPQGERVVADLTGVAAAARERLYKGEVRKQGGSKGRTRTVRDPLVAAITPIVVREHFEKTKAANPNYKYSDAMRDIGGDGLAYLKSRIETLVAGGQDRATLEKFLDEKYIKPAQMLIGTKTNKATEGQSLL